MLKYVFITVDTIFLQECVIVIFEFIIIPNVNVIVRLLLMIFSSALMGNVVNFDSTKSE